MVSRFASLLFAFHSTCYFSLSVSSGHAAAAAAVAGRRRLRQRRGRHLQRLPHDRIGAWTSLVGRDPPVGEPVLSVFGFVLFFKSIWEKSASEVTFI